MRGSVLTLFSLCVLCALCASVVELLLTIAYHRDTESTEDAQRIYQTRTHSYGGVL